ncbi:MAG TPA: hypothetical protein VHW71_13495 [Steroidobacteraceae bacterium]|jgi:hypothetical protein|nr:hypothetical protein [Steroidobacteraceae bacterium]
MNERHKEKDDAVAVEGQLYLLTANAECWKCRRPQDVVVIAAQGLSEGGEAISDTQDLGSLVSLSTIEEMPSELLTFIQKRQPGYQKQYSRAAETSYYANTCQCGALFGDHYLVSKPGGAFFPEDSAAAARIVISRVPCRPPQLLRGDYSVGSVGEMIWESARWDSD